MTNNPTSISSGTTLSPARHEWDPDTTQPAYGAGRAGEILVSAFSSSPATLEAGEDQRRGKSKAPPLPSPLPHRVAERELSEQEEGQ